MVINIIKVLVALVPAIITTMSNRDKENRWKTSFTILAIIVLGIAIECLISWIYSEIVIGYTFMDNLIFSHIMVGLVMFIAAIMYSIAYREKRNCKQFRRNVSSFRYLVYSKYRFFKRCSSKFKRFNDKYSNLDFASIVLYFAL